MDQSGANNLSAQPLHVEAGFRDPSYTAQFQAWIKLQNDWRADAYVKKGSDPLSPKRGLTPFRGHEGAGEGDGTMQRARKPSPRSLYVLYPVPLVRAPRNAPLPPAPTI
jgi:hypothetical protein